VGTGTEAVLGRSVTVQYTGWLYHPNAAQNRGPQFDSGTFGPFVLGTTVIQGWTQGLQGMRIGGSRRLVIPPDLGYGPTGQGPIPGNATLLFEVTLINVQ
jgi:FKBP-type peptidyl-prolyl cis-trans isomerase FkpA